MGDPDPEGGRPMRGLIRAKLIDVGRRKYTGEVGFNTLRGLYLQIKKKAQLMSRYIEIVAEDGSKEGRIYAGVYLIGRIELLGGSFKTIRETSITVVPEGAEA